MKKILCTLMVIMLAWVASDALAQTQKVTYTLTGRPAGWLFVKGKDLGMSTSGARPVGAYISRIEGVDYDEGGDEPEFSDGVNMGAVLGIPLLPQYVVKPNSTASIYFENFRYEVKQVWWTRRSQVMLISSKGTTSLTNYNGETAGKWNFSTSASESYNSSWEFVYEKETFAPDGSYNGLHTLDIACTSKQALHGIAIKDFEIEYYVPTITINGAGYTDKIDTDADERNLPISLTIAHQGSFKDSEIYYSCTSDPNGVTIYGSGKSATINVPANYEGVATITAEIKVPDENDNLVTIAKNSYRMRVGEDPEFEWVKGTIYSTHGGSTSAYPQSGSNAQVVSNVLTTTDASFDWQVFNTTPDANGLVAEIRTTGSGSQDWRVGLGVMAYKQKVPAYSTAAVSYSINTQATTNQYGQRSGLGLGWLGNTYNWHGSESINLGETAWAPNGTDIITINHIANNTTTSITSRTNAASLSFANSQTTVNLQGSANTWNRTYTNTENNVDEERLKDNNELHYFGQSAYNLNIKADNNYYEGNVSSHNGNRWEEGYFYAKNRSVTYTYYTYINYYKNSDDANGDTPVTTSTISSSTLVPSPIYGTTGLASCGYNREGYAFKGWNTEADGSGTEYQPGDFLPAYDELNKSGMGPVKLYAQWKKVVTEIPDDIDDIDPDELEEILNSIHVYSLWGNGGTIGSEEVVADAFGYGMDAPESVTQATRDGFDFLGYYDSTEKDGDGNPTGNQVFDADGHPVSTTIFSGGKWIAEEDVYVYAMWKENSVTPPTVYTLTFKLNATENNPRFKDNTNADKQLPVIKGDAQNNNVSSLAPKRDNHTFTGWYTAGGTMVYNQNGESVVLAGYTVDGDGNELPDYKAVSDYFTIAGKYNKTANETLYAHWIADDIVLTFNEGGKAANAATWKIGSAEAQHFTTTPTYDEAEYSKVIITRTLKPGSWNTVCFPFDVYSDQVDKLFDKVMMYNSLEANGDDATMKFVKCNEMMAGKPYFVKMMESGDYADNEWIDSDDHSKGKNNAWVSGTNGDNVTELTFIDVTTTKNDSEISINDKTGTITVDMVGKFNTVLHIGDGTGFDPSTKEYLYLQNDNFYVSGGWYDVDHDGNANEQVWGNNQGFRCYFSQPKSSHAKNIHIDLEGYDGWTGDGIEEVEMDEVVDSSSAMYDISGRRLTHAPRKGIYIMNGKKFIVK